MNETGEPYRVALQAIRNQYRAERTATAEAVMYSRAGWSDIELGALEAEAGRGTLGFIVVGTAIVVRGEIESADVSYDDEVGERLDMVLRLRPENAEQLPEGPVELELDRASQERLVRSAVRLQRLKGNQVGLARGQSRAPDEPGMSGI